MAGGSAPCRPVPASSRAGCASPSPRAGRSGVWAGTGDSLAGSCGDGRRPLPPLRRRLGRDGRDPRPFLTAVAQPRCSSPPTAKDSRRRVRLRFLQCQFLHQHPAASPAAKRSSSSSYLDGCGGTATTSAGSAQPAPGWGLHEPAPAAARAHATCTWGPRKAGSLRAGAAADPDCSSRRLLPPHASRCCCRCSHRMLSPLSSPR